MHLSTTAQNDTATLIAKWVRENTIGYGAVVSEVSRPSCRAAAVVCIAKNGSTTCTAKVVIYRNRIVYVSKLGAHISYPTIPKDADRIVGAFLSLEDD